MAAPLGSSRLETHELDWVEAWLGLAVAIDRGKQGVENKHRTFGCQLFQSSIVTTRGDMGPMINSVVGSNQDALYPSIAVSSMACIKHLVKS